MVWAGKAGRNQRAIDQREPVWLLVEWRDGESEPANYFFCSIAERMTRKRLVRLVMQRWRTERAYEDLEGELGLDHHARSAVTARGGVLADDSGNSASGPPRLAGG